MITITFDTQRNKFLIKCGFEENKLIVQMPDKRFRKGSRTWAVPALRRNIQFMAKHLSNPQMYSQDALAIFNKKRKELTVEPAGENKFPVNFEFKNPPLDFQDKGLKKWFPLNEAGIFYEQGLGKTFTSINLAAAWRMTNQIDAAIVICPSSIKMVWHEELEKHCPIPFEHHAIQPGKKKATGTFCDSPSINMQWLIVGIEGLSQGNAHEYVDKFMLSRRCVIIIDESSRIKTPGKTRTDRCVKFGPKATKRMILSGTSVTQGIEDLYTQFKFLNPDIIGYDSFYSFRAQYCITMTMEVAQDRFIQKIVGYKNQDELMELLKPYVMRVEKADAVDLPPKVFTNRYITMNPTQKKMYQEMKEELFIEGIEWNGDKDIDEYEVTTVLEQMLRLQQITGGHYPVDDGEVITATPIPGKNPKITELMNVIEEVKGKIIIWCQFRPEITLVAEALRKADITFVEFHGGCDEAEKIHAKRALQIDPEVKVFLATRAAAYGLTLTAASTAIYYSQSYSLEEYAQSQDRIHRIGQNDPCDYVHLVCDKTVDVKVIRALRDKKAVADMIYSLLKD